MAHSASGERSLTIDGKRVTLRLDIGTIMSLEDYFNTSLVQLLSDAATGRVGTISRLFVALTGQDFTDEDVVKRAADSLIREGLVKTATEVIRCLKLSLFDQEGEHTDSRSEPEKVKAQKDDRA